MTETQAGSARNVALRLLTLRDRSERELKEKLKGKGFESQDIDNLLDDLRALGYINDQNFTQRQVRYLAHEKLYGNRRIERQLMEKGLPREQIRKAIGEIRQEFPEKEALTILLGKKAAKRPKDNNAGYKRRLAQHLMGKGYPPELIYNMLEEQIHDDDSE